MAQLSFTKKIIGELVNPRGPGAMNTFSNVGDINRDGFIDLVICGRYGQMVWMENPGTIAEWKQHTIDQVEMIECGGSLFDLTGSGYPDIIVGGESNLDEIYWWENPGETGGRWQTRLIAKTGHGQFHDTVIGDVTGDGTLSLLFTNQQEGTTIYRVPLPDDPRISPWPGLEAVGKGKRKPNPHHPWNPEGYQPEEGLAVGDIDGDGRNEVVCGTYWYKYRGVPGEKWEEHQFADDYLTTKVAIGDINGDGRNEILLSEGDAYVYGIKEGGKFAWFSVGEDITALWEEHIVEQGLLDAHSLQLGNICGNGNLDILLAEVGAADPQTDDYILRPPRILVYENDGKANFTRHVIDEGTGTHDAVLADLRNKGVLDVIGKPLHGPEKWKIHVWYNNGADLNAGKR